MRDHRKGFSSAGGHHHHGQEHQHKGEGFGRGAGRGGRARRGEARFVLLDALRDGAKHGYEIIKVLEERSFGEYAPSPGTVYPTLQYLEDLALVSAEQDAERRVYHLTEKGKAELEVRADEINVFWSRFQKPDTSPAGQVEVSFLQEELQLLEQTIWRVVRAATDPNDHETIRRIRLTVEQCRNEVRHIATEPKKQN